MLEKGDPSVTGFISNMKGKVFEVYLKDNLPLDYPGYSFEIAKDPTQPVWDLTGISENGGEEIFVQAKMWDESRARDLIELMEENPDVLYATNIEMREKIVEINPELVNRFVPVDLSNFEFTDDVRDALETLADNFGLNMPDSVFALVPYSTEIILGVKFIFELASVNRDFSKVNFDEKSRIAALKVLVLFTRFGVTTILTFAGSAAGSFVPGYGNVVGGIGGAIASSMINKIIKPYILEIAYKLVGIHPEDMFYYKNSDRIDKLGISYINNKNRLLFE
jgi:hypothetical protein